MLASVYDPTTVAADAFDRSNHAGTQTASTISDFDAEVANNVAVAANTAKVTNATHTGDVTGATALTIAADVVTNAMLVNVATSTIKGRITALTGDPEDLTATQARTLLNVEDGSTADQTALEIEAIVSHDLLLDYAIGQHRVIDDATVSTTVLWSSDKIDSVVSAVSAGIDLKDPVETGTLSGDGNITLSGEQTIRGVTTSTSRVILTDQTSGAENGAWVTAAGAWTRTSDFDEDADATNGARFFVGEPSSTVYRYEFILTTADPIVIDTTVLTFAALRPLDFGTTSGTATEGNDARVPSQDENDALVGTDGVPSTLNKYVTNSDSRMSDARTPTSHAASHQDGGSDEVATATSAAAAIPKADGSGKLDTWISAASPTVAGIMETAIVSEVNTGTDDARAVSPASLAGSTLSSDVATNNAKATNATHTGDVTGATALTIAADAVTNAMLADVATARIKGRVTALTGDPEDLTGTQATTLLDEFTTTLQGVVPGSGGGTANFLRADGTWIAPPGGGTDELVGVSANDTTPGYLLDKMTTATAGVAWTEINDGADEDLQLDIDSASTGGQGLIELATQTEVNTGTDTTRAVTPATLAGTPMAQKRTIVASAIDITLVAANLGSVVLLTSGANATLPAPGTVGSGWWVDIKEAGNSTLSDIVPSGVEDIDGTAASESLGKYEARTMVTDGTDWWSI
jgi:hypothetical protein